ncbi:MAG: NAD(P) transhydrogenase subunit alpha [Planctomycetota bacterium]|nr:MAG: NAD(P) transhydrogenase subunit alpha [Planctomycetota bacterium]
MLLGVPKETFPGERRVALVPGELPRLARQGIEVAIEAGAGQAAGFADRAYEDRGARVIAEREALFAEADGIIAVRAAAANPEAGAADLERLREGQLLVGFLEPLGNEQAMERLAARGVTAFAMELIPRITRAQGMDALSSMATVSGYRAALLAAAQLPRFFPMLMTAAGTVPAARVLVIGAGVAGLQAIATARRLGAVVEAYDVRPEVKEEVQSVGARFLELPLAAAGDEQGYAREQSEEFLRQQRELLQRAVAEADVVITTAAVPGKRAPRILTAAMVEGMKRGAVIVDLAAERGGNCELTVAGETAEHHGVTILGPLNLPASMPVDASRMYARNVANLLLHLIRDGALVLEPGDPIVADAMVAHQGRITSRRLGGEPPGAEAAPAPAAPGEASAAAGASSGG